MSFATVITSLINGAEVTEQKVVTLINQAWAEVQKVEAWADAELADISTWIATHLTGIDAALNEVAGLLPSTAPEIAAAELALAAAGAASTALAANLKAGSTPISTVQNAYVAVTDARTAVTAVLQLATVKPAS